MKWAAAIIILTAIAFVAWFARGRSSHEEMIQLLDATREKMRSPDNPFYPEGKIFHYDSLIAKGGNGEALMMLNYHKTLALLQLGEEEQAIEILESFIGKLGADRQVTARIARTYLALAYMRLGERANCVSGHAAESCILPIRGRGIHADRRATIKAKELYLQLMESDSNDLESRWLLNIVCMTLGEYPAGVPARWLIPGLDEDPVESKADLPVKPFVDIAPTLHLDVRNMAGGTIVDDFNNDGYLDIVSSGWGLEEPMHYFRNNANGSFTDISATSGLGRVTGGLHMIQADYDNDGFTDIFVLRGAWKDKFGTEPNSLLHNNGDETFTDVTTVSGLLSFHPTQTGTWNDFNNDGWLDLFIGNETQPRSKDKHPCELYINQKDGTFTEIAAKAKCDVIAFIKGVTSGDYDNDGRQDLFISTLQGKKILLKNISQKDEIQFEDVSQKAGLSSEDGNTFPTWFWDYNNDGWLDLFVCGYNFKKSLAGTAAAVQLGMSAADAETMILFENNRDGTFTNVNSRVGLNKMVFAMGSNFGDIDNDGFLDLYLGTGNPSLSSVIPNKMFRNSRARRFVDVTVQARVGNLQKGHAVSFADMDNDGDQDICIDMGGAYSGDAYPSSFFLNPGQGKNNWISLLLEGSGSNRSAIGARIKITFHEGDSIRSVYRDVNTGGSFGSSPLRREIGIGGAEKIDEIEIRWTGSDKLQVFTDILPNQFLKIKEGATAVTKIQLKVLTWPTPL